MQGWAVDSIFSSTPFSTLLGAGIGAEMPPDYPILVSRETDVPFFRIGLVAVQANTTFDLFEFFRGRRDVFYGENHGL